MLATTEAFSNAILHGTECSDGEKGILLRVLPWEDGLCVEVCDCGRFDSGPAPTGCDEPHGRGIPLITAVVDRFELVPGGPLTRVHFAKRRTLAAAAAHRRRGQALGPR